MLFPTHLLVAAILGRLSTLSIPWLVVGAAVPDLVDKSLGLVGIVDLYHTVGHSVLLLVVAVPIALYHSTGRAAAVGWGSHLAFDTVHMVINGRPADVLSLGWPVTTPPDPLALPPIPFLFHYIGSPSFFLEIALWLVAAVIVLSDIRPDIGMRRRVGGDE